MALNIGNQFNYGREKIDYGKVPLWDSVDEQYPSGVFIEGKQDGDATNGIPKIGETIFAGTPVELDFTNKKVKLADKAENPLGLTRYDATVGTDGCTLTIVTRGAIYADRFKGKAADVEAKLAPRILFIRGQDAKDPYGAESN